MVQMVLRAMVLQQPVVLAVFMAAVVVVVRLMAAALVALVQFVLFGRVLHASFQIQAREICDEFVYSFKRWATT
jgi:hypothetical protein